MKNPFRIGNSKMAATAKANNCNVYTFDLPAIKTCPFAKHCKERKDPTKAPSVENGGYCFACKGRYAFNVTKDAYEINWELTKRPDFVDIAVPMLQALAAKSKKRGFVLDGVRYSVVIRLDASGDIYSREYLLKLFAVAAQVPNVLFYCYTKSHPLFKGLAVPNNFKYIPSKGGTHDHLLKGKPCAIVVPVETKQEDLPVGTVLGVQDDLMNLKSYLSGKTVALKIH